MLKKWQKILKIFDKKNRSVPSVGIDSKPISNNGYNDLLWLYKQKSILAIHLAGFVVALISPADVLSRSDFLAQFVGKVSHYLPIVINFAKKSAFPEVAQLYGALMVISWPYWLWVWFKWPYLEKQIIYMLGLARASFWKILIWPFIIIVALIMTYLVLFIDIRVTEFKTIPFHSSRLALSLFGPVLYCWMPATGLGIAFLGFNVFVRYFKGK